MKRFGDILNMSDNNEDQELQTYSYENMGQLCFKTASLILISSAIVFVVFMLRYKISKTFTLLLFLTLFTYFVGDVAQYLYTIRLLSWNIILAVHFGVGGYILSHVLANFTIRHLYNYLNDKHKKSQMYFNIYLLMDALFSIAIYGLWVGSIHSFNSNGRILASWLFISQIAVNSIVTSAYSFRMVRPFFKECTLRNEELSGQGYFAFILERTFHVLDAAVMFVEISNQTAVSNFCNSMRYCFLLAFVWNIRGWLKQKPF
eukprot:NODE_347_length_10448_cov_0.163687.p3 type:complete len:260 gc:universal NODE_347_length_10448_cov_0.163687:4884-4105(-)